MRREPLHPNPATPSPAAGALAAYALLLLGGAVIGALAHWAGWATSSWMLLEIALVVLITGALIMGHAWARWGALALALSGLIVLSPVILALVTDPGALLLLPRPEIVAAAVQGATLVALIVLVVGTRPR